MKKRVKYFRLSPNGWGVADDAIYMSDSEMTEKLKKGSISLEVLRKYSIGVFYRDVFVPFPTMAVLGGLLLVSGILSLLFIITL